MEQNTKLQALKDAYERCLATGIVRNQSEFSDLIEINRTTLSSAMNGRPQALTDSLVAKAVKIANELTSRVQSPDYTVPIACRSFPMPCAAAPSRDSARAWKSGNVSASRRPYAARSWPSR